MAKILKPDIGLLLALLMVPLHAMKPTLLEESQILR